MLRNTLDDWPTSVGGPLVTTGMLPALCRLKKMMCVKMCFVVPCLGIMMCVLCFVVLFKTNGVCLMLVSEYRWMPVSRNNCPTSCPWDLRQLSLIFPNFSLTFSNAAIVGCVYEAHSCHVVNLLLSQCCHAEKYLVATLLSCYHKCCHAAIVDCVYEAHSCHAAIVDCVYGSS